MMYAKLIGAGVIALIIGFLGWNYISLQDEVEAKAKVIATQQVEILDAKATNDGFVSQLAELKGYQARAAVAERELDQARAHIGQTIAAIRKEARHVPDSKACASSGPVRTVLERLRVGAPDRAHEAAAGAPAVAGDVLPAGAAKP